MNASNRCDRCGAQAYVSLFALAGALELCSHHFSVHADALLDAGWTVDIDERDRLVVKP